MRRLITTLGIVLVVIVAGVSALVLLVNPNDFRAYMIQQVEQRSGYRLALLGSLRWHVWPQLSILSGRMSVTAPGASQPLIDAENMRLDVSLLPLLSHQLRVRQVMLNNAVIRMMPASEAKRPEDAPIGPSDGGKVLPVSDWNFDIQRLHILNSLLIWQQSTEEQINFRNIDLYLKQKRHKKVQVDLKTLLNRDQRVLHLALEGSIDGTQYPQQLAADIRALHWQLKGAELPPQGLQGEAAMLVRWQNASQQFSLENLSLTVNDNSLQGSLSGKLNASPELHINLQAASIDMDKLTGDNRAEAGAGRSTAQGEVNRQMPVISLPVTGNGTNPFFQAVSAKLKLKIDKLRWRDVDVKQILLEAASKDGQVSMSTLTGSTDSGDFSLPGVINLLSSEPEVTVHPQLHNIELSSFFKSVPLPDAISGTLSMDAILRGKGLSAAAFQRDWQGEGRFSVKDARLHGLNFMQMVRHTTADYSVQSPEKETQVNDTELQQLAGTFRLYRGQLTADTLQGQASLFSFSGHGDIDLVRQQSDIRLQLLFSQQWQGSERLNNTAVPLRLYGPWDALQYSLSVNAILRKNLHDEEKSRIADWLKHRSDTAPRQDKQDVPH